VLYSCPVPRRTQSDQELLDYSLEHVAYEVEMLRGTEALLAAIGARAVDTTRVVRNALIESWMVHVQDLVEFLYPSSSPQPDDVIADDFFDRGGDWNRIRPRRGREPTRS
jgi:hypothetical protein